MSQRRPFWYLRRRPENIADDVDEELRHHFAMRVEELKTRGIPEEAARQEALRRFGDVEATRRYCRAQDEEKATGMQRTLMLQDFGQDVRVCLRNVSRAPVLTLTILLTVGLGIGATTAIFAALNAALLRPLPYASPDRLVRIYTDAPPFKFRLSAADYLAVQEQQTQFERIAYYTDRLMTFSDGQSAELLRGREVSPTYFGVLGIVPAAGRDFGDQDGRPGGAPASIVSYGFWLRQLGGRADAIGQPIRLDGAEYTVVGVLPRQSAHSNGNSSSSSRRSSHPRRARAPSCTRSSPA